MQNKVLSPEEASRINPFIESESADTMNAVSAGIATLQLLTTANLEFMEKREGSGLFYILGCMEGALHYAVELESMEVKS